ncbi:DUF3459 domain-containing protein, partial [Streptomyces sp. NPDC006334]|uniref:DUF3459 domain-containing protein n=1 Tax=Streptomyces sp. NPDC006334 TaxID=3156754 RepID=UPI0033B5ACC5
QGEELTWEPDSQPGVLAFARTDGWRCVVNLSPEPVPLPPGEVLMSSAPLDDGGALGPDTTVWLA